MGMEWRGWAVRRRSGERIAHYSPNLREPSPPSLYLKSHTVLGTVTAMLACCMDNLHHDTIRSESFLVHSVHTAVAGIDWTCRRKATRSLLQGIFPIAGRQMLPTIAAWQGMGTGTAHLKLRKRRTNRPQALGECLASYLLSGIRGAVSNGTTLGVVFASMSWHYVSELLQKDEKVGVRAP